MPVPPGRTVKACRETLYRLKKKLDVGEGGIPKATVRKGRVTKNIKAKKGANGVSDGGAACAGEDANGVDTDADDIDNGACNTYAMTNAARETPTAATRKKRKAVQMEESVGVKVEEQGEQEHGLNAEEFDGYEENGTGHGLDLGMVGLGEELNIEALV